MAQILKHSGSWGYRISYYDKFGKRKFVNKFGFKKKSDATEAARDLELKKKSTNLEKREYITLADYYNDWIKTYKLGKYSRNTELRYIAFGKSIYQYFGNSLLKDITKADYQKFIDQYSKSRSKASVRRVNGYVSTVLDDAIDEQLISRDFTHNVLISGSDPKPADLKYLELDEATRLKKYAYERLSLKAISIFTKSYLRWQLGAVMAKLWG